MKAGLAEHPRASERITLRRAPRLIVRGLSLAWSVGRLELILISLFQVLEGLGVFAILWLGRDLLNAILDRGHDQLSSLTVPVLLAVLAFFLYNSAEQLAINRRQVLGEVVALRVMERVLRVTSSVGLAAFDTEGFHDRLQRVSTGMVGRPVQASRPMQLVQGLAGVLEDLLMLVGMFAVLFVIQPLVGLVALLVVVPWWLGSIRSGEQNFDFVRRTASVERERGYLFELLTRREPAKEVRAFNLGEFLYQRWGRSSEKRLSELKLNLRRRMKSEVLSGLAISVMIVVALCSVLVFNEADLTSFADALTVAATLVLIAQSMTNAIGSAKQFFESVPLVDDLADFLEWGSVGGGGCSSEGVGVGSLVCLGVEGVSFSYPGSDRLVLTDVSLEIGAGEVVALVGENGSGKTTLAKLLCGLYGPGSGRVVWNGGDVAEMDSERYREGIAVLFQDFIRYLLPVRDNIAFGRYERADDLAGVREAARQAGASDFLEALPDGYGTVLGPEFEGGRDLSVGQWQRVALARAFFRGASFVILDEPTASLDARAEFELFESIRSLCEGRTVLLISHRFSTVRTADRIFVLREGRLIESGGHAELMALGGHYAQLFTLQAASYQDEAQEPGGTTPVQRRGEA
ncbi:ABC transporter ATP-binding protein [Actinomadura sp. 9N215]|uniref:ABC transporter ATP-binding protein n=1 Tax=Actinomadura sp. 9N215 TaxID=3375150 RepID=UPI003787362D